MARPWESALNFEPTINRLTLHPVCPECVAPGGRAASHFVVAVAPAVGLTLGSFRLRVLLLCRFTGSIRLRVLLLFWFTNFGVPSSFGVGCFGLLCTSFLLWVLTRILRVGWLFFLGCFGLLYIGFLRWVLTHILYVGWLFSLGCCGLLYTGFLRLLLILIVVCLAGLALTQGW